MVTGQWWNGGVPEAGWSSPWRPGREPGAGAPGNGPVPGGSGEDPLRGFHPVVAEWFQQRFPAGPTPAQRAAWPLVRAGRDVVVSAPTGGGKTLAAFLVAIDQALREPLGGEVGPQVLYVSPLRALAVDVKEHLVEPLEELARVAAARGLALPAIPVGVRTGDTPAAERARMAARPPRILVTTPESLYLLLTAARSRETLRQVRTVVVDEVHSLVGTARGAHLALSLARLDGLQAGGRPQRIGLSATARPLGEVARFLVGRARAKAVEVVAVDEERATELRVALPSEPLAAVLSNAQLEELADRLALEASEHRSTLVFVATRRFAERLARLVEERLGEGRVAAHHGSLSATRRRQVEARLRAGDLQVVVATASLELGIDVGPVELVCQVGSPRALGTFLQRVGRANHRVGGVARAVLYPTTRDELVEIVALLGARRQGGLEALAVRRGPLDVLTQQLVAEVAAAGCVEEERLFEMVQRAAPYEDLDRATFERLVGLVSEGIPTGHGRRLAWLHRDGVHRRLRPRRGARLSAVVNGGTIPDSGDYRVVLDPEGLELGSVTEDFALETMAGDVFTLGTHSWRVLQVHDGWVRVADAGGAAPTVPFWVGEAPGRSPELSAAVGRLRRWIEERGDEPRSAVVAALAADAGVDPAVAGEVVDYLRAALAQLGRLPTDRCVVIERCFDEAGSMQLIVHAPLGARIMRALGLALRKRFCTTFDFELQAAANDDAALLSLGAQHGLALADVPALLRAAGRRAVLAQAVLTSPLFPVHWRHVAVRSLAVARSRAGRRVPLPIQRMQAADLMAAVFPALAACQENTASGPVPVPDHPLVAATLAECLEEVLDGAGMEAVVGDLEAGRLTVHLAETVEPSVLAHEILHGRPYTFLDDAPLEERRSRAVRSRPGPALAVPLTVVPPEVCDEVAAWAAAPPRDAEELHDLLLRCSPLVPEARWSRWFEELQRAGRAVGCRLPGEDGVQRWCASERWAAVRACWPAAVVTAGSAEACASASGPDGPDPDDAAAAIVEGHLERSGAVSEEELVRATGLGRQVLRRALASLQQRGLALQGPFDPRLGPEAQWAHRRSAQRLHSGARRARRATTVAVPLARYGCFLQDWQHLTAEQRLEGASGVRAVVEQLQGLEVPAGWWERGVLAARVRAYEPAWLDGLCQRGEVAWARLREPAGGEGMRRAGLHRNTPLGLVPRRMLAQWLGLVRGERPAEAGTDRLTGSAAELRGILETEGALFLEDLVDRTGRLPSDVLDGLAVLAASGLVTADSFEAVRSLVSRGRRRGRGSGGGRRGGWVPQGVGGRFSVLPAAAIPDQEAAADLVVSQLATCWGLVCRETAALQRVAVPWLALRRAARQQEAQGLLLGGRFVAGLSGEQFVPPGVPERLADQRGGPTPLRLARHDPLVLAARQLPGLAQLDVAGSGVVVTPASEEQRAAS